MTRDELQRLVETYINNNLYISETISKALKSGSIDIESIEPEQYLEVKAIAHAVLLSIANDFRPLTKEGKKISKNIQLFI
jgi:hypothetical protein